MSVIMTSQQWLQTFQVQELDKFLQRGLPTRKEENWKYTNVAGLEKFISKQTGKESVELESYSPRNDNFITLLFINGMFSSASNTHKLPKGVTLSSVSQAMYSHEEMIKSYLTTEFDVQKSPFAVLNSARMRDGVFLQVPKNTLIEEPIHIVFLNTQNNQAVSCPRNIILVEEGAEVTYIEEYLSDTEMLTSPVTEIHAGNNARIRYYKIQDEGLLATHMANMFVHQKQDSRVDLFTLTKGAKLSREDVVINLSARGAECDLLGLYALTHDDQHTDHHLHVDHIAEHGKSSMLYKGILDKKTSAVFNGKVYVHPKAQHISAHQANHNLLLSKEAEINTKPELEIYADDVKCAHGATVGQLNVASLFYLRSRGMTKEIALKVLLEAFADEIISQIKNPIIRQYILERVNNHVEL